MPELTPKQLAAEVAQAPVLRRAPGLRDEIVAALERIPELERRIEAWEQDYASQGQQLHRVVQRAERLEAAAREVEQAATSFDVTHPSVGDQDLGDEHVGWLIDDAALADTPDREEVKGDAD